MNLVEAFKQLIDNAPLEVVERLNKQQYRYADAYNHINSHRVGVTVYSDCRLTLSINLNEGTQVIRSFVPYRSEVIAVLIKEDQLTDLERNMFIENMKRLIETYGESNV